MRHPHRWTKVPVALLPLILLSACATNKIRDLEQQVHNLDQKVRLYQQQYSEETAETSGTLRQVNKTINSRLQEIEYTQDNFNDMLDQISNRLVRLEKTVTDMQERINRVASYSEGTADLAQDLQGGMEATQKQLAGQVEQLNSELDQLKQTQNSENQKTTSMINSLENRLTQKIHTMEENTQAIYRKILRELGAEPPQQTRAEEGESYDGQVHIVQPGDTLSKIASEYNVTMKQLQNFNNISNPSLIQVGQRIKIP